MNQFGRPKRPACKDKRTFTFGLSSVASSGDRHLNQFCVVPCIPSRDSLSSSEAFRASFPSYRETARDRFPPYVVHESLLLTTAWLQHGKIGGLSSTPQDSPPRRTLRERVLQDKEKAGGAFLTFLSRPLHPKSKSVASSFPSATWLLGVSTGIDRQILEPPCAVCKRRGQFSLSLYKWLAFSTSRSPVPQLQVGVHYRGGLF